MTDISPFYLIPLGVLSLAVVVEFVILLGLVRTIYGRSAAESVEGPRQLDRGSRIPSFAARDLNGEVVSSESLIGKFMALLFVSPTCVSCMTTLQETHALQHKALGNLVLVCRATTDECKRLVARYDLTLPTLVDDTNAISQALGVVGTPTALLIDEEGRVISYGNPVRRDEIEELVESPSPA